MKEKTGDFLMEVQTGLIELCLQLTEGKVEKIFAYASMEDRSWSFNAFFEKEGKLITTDKLGVPNKTIFDFLDLGIEDLEKIYKYCEENGERRPTEIKMYYDVKSGTFDAHYEYDVRSSIKTGMSAGQIFDEWYEEVKKQQGKENNEQR